VEGEKQKMLSEREFKEQDQAKIKDINSLIDDFLKVKDSKIAIKIIKKYNSYIKFLKQRLKDKVSTQLVNINLNHITKEQQLNKIHEEDEEFLQAVKLNDYDNMIEEFWDCVQVRLGYLNMHGIRATEVMNGYNKHLRKLKNRPRGK
jgi:phosphoribosyl-ATP pyrophosphohydrolase